MRGKTEQTGSVKSPMPTHARCATLGVACGLVGGVAASVAVVRDGERALAVLVALAPLAMAVGFLAAELIGGLV